MQLLSQQLKENTIANHRHLEGQMMPLLKNIKTREDYINLLLLFYTFLGGLELLIGSAIDSCTVTDYAQRRKIAAIEKDLKELNIENNQSLCGKADLPVITDNYQALGALYVMEGSTLGGTIIRKMILDRLPSAFHAVTFFTSYGPGTMKMWNAFKQSLDSALFVPEEQIKVIDAANQTFSCFSRWIDHEPMQKFIF